MGLTHILSAICAHSVVIRGQTYPFLFYRRWKKRLWCATRHDCQENTGLHPIPRNLVSGFRRKKAIMLHPDHDYYLISQAFWQRYHVFLNTATIAQLTQDIPCRMTSEMSSLEYPSPSMRTVETVKCTAQFHRPAREQLYCSSSYRMSVVFHVPKSHCYDLLHGGCNIPMTFREQPIMKHASSNSFFLRYTKTLSDCTLKARIWTTYINKHQQKCCQQSIIWPDNLSLAQGSWQGERDIKGRKIGQNNDVGIANLADTAISGHRMVLLHNVRVKVRMFAYPT